MGGKQPADAALLQSTCVESCKVRVPFTPRRCWLEALGSFGECTGLGTQCLQGDPVRWCSSYPCFGGEDASRSIAKHRLG